MNIIGLTDLQTSVDINVFIIDKLPSLFLLPFVPHSPEPHLKYFKYRNPISIKTFKNKLKRFVDNFQLQLNFNLRLIVLAYSLVIVCYSSYNSCCPIKPESSKDLKKLEKTQDIITSINKKYEMFRLYKQGSIAFNTYNSHKNHLTKLTIQAQTNYYLKQFNALKIIPPNIENNK